MSKRTLLVMDFQNAILSRHSSDPTLVSRVRQVISSARDALIPVIYVAVKFRPDYPEVSSRNKLFSAIKLGPLSLEENNSATDIHASLAPQPGDIVVTKRRVSAFSGSDLEVVLRSQHIEHLVLTGIATSGVVLSTLRAAACRRLVGSSPNFKKCEHRAREYCFCSQESL